MNNQKKYLHFQLLQILKEETDSEHPMRQKDLVQRLGVDRGTVSRALGDLLDDPLNSRVRSVNLEKESEDGDDEKRSYHSNVYYDHEFSTAELRWLIDGILFSRNVPHAQRDELIGKLIALGGRQFRQTRSMAKVRRLSGDEPTNKELFNNIELINKAIDEQKKISTVYCFMGPDFTLEPSAASAGGPQILNPYAMVVRNGFYFLICSNNKYNSLTHYRIDRMTEVKIRKEPVKPIRELEGFRAGFDIQEYMSHNINMAFGKPERITFIAKPKAVREIIDAFGRGVTFTRRKDGDLDCVVYVPEYDMERWVLQFGDIVTVTGPETLLEKLKHYSMILADKYGKETPAEPQ